MVALLSASHAANSSSSSLCRMPRPMSQQGEASKEAMMSDGRMFDSANPHGDMKHDGSTVHRVPYDIGRRE